MSINAQIRTSPRIPPAPPSSLFGGQRVITKLRFGLGRNKSTSEAAARAEGHNKALGYLLAQFIKDAQYRSLHTCVLLTDNGSRCLITAAARERKHLLQCLARITASLISAEQNACRY